MNRTIYDFEVTDLGGRKVNLEQYKGKVLLIVNIASKCGNTPQLGGLEHLYEKYKDRGFEILAFPSNDFHQEPKEGEKIMAFCVANYGVKFKVFQKGPVKGKNAQPLYKFLAERSKVAFINNYPIWNFQKYLVDRNGRVVNFFNPWKDPENAKITAAIEKELDKMAVEN